MVDKEWEAKGREWTDGKRREDRVKKPKEEGLPYKEEEEAFNIRQHYPLASKSFAS